MVNIGDSETTYIFPTYQKFLDLFPIHFKQELEQDISKVLSDNKPTGIKAHGLLVLPALG